MKVAKQTREKGFEEKRGRRRDGGCSKFELIINGLMKRFQMTSGRGSTGGKAHQEEDL